MINDPTKCTTCGGAGELDLFVNRGQVCTVCCGSGRVPGLHQSHESTMCSRCGGEKDAEGWCANYCTDDDHDDVVVDCSVCSDKDFIDCATCGGTGELDLFIARGQICAVCSGSGRVPCPHMV